MKVNAQNIVIIDIDGTLADVEHRVSHVRKSPPDWKSFNAQMHRDSLNEWCKELMTSLQSQGFGLMLLTGRSERQREVTLEWLQQHQVPFDDLFMRAADDTRPDAVVKEEIYRNELAQHNVLFVVEDRRSVVQMWRKLGLVCLQCADGNF